MFRAAYLSRPTGTVVAELRDLDDTDLDPGEVTIDVEYSTVNYKDGLAYAGRPGVVRDYPIIPGVDLAGVVASSTDARFAGASRFSGV